LVSCATAANVVGAAFKPSLKSLSRGFPDPDDPRGFAPDRQPEWPEPEGLSLASLLFRAERLQADRTPPTRPHAAMTKAFDRVISSEDAVKRRPFRLGDLYDRLRQRAYGRPEAMNEVELPEPLD
jgi:hypothetical protein